MLKIDIEEKEGFSLLEILVSLFIVSFTAVNIVGLQQMISGQNRDRFTYSAVLGLAAEKMETVLQYPLVADVEALDGLKETITTTQPETQLTLRWDVTKPSATYNAGGNLRDVGLQIDWCDSKRQWQTFVYNQQINLNRLLNSNSNTKEEVAVIVESCFDQNDVIYFEAKTDYKKGTFVIYNSELFEALTAQSSENGPPRDRAFPTIVSDAWKSYGLIDSSVLADNAALETLFVN